MTVYALGSGVQGSPGRIGRMRMSNRARTQAEMSARFLAGVPEADRGASQISAVSGNVLNGTSLRAFSTFSSTTNSFSGVSGSADSSLNQAGFALTFSSGRRYRVKANYTLTGTLGAASLRVLLTTSLSDTTGASNSETFTAASGSIDVVLTAVSSLSGIVAFAFGVSPTTDVTVSVTDIEIIRLGLTADYAPSAIQLAPGQWHDGANKKHMHIPDGFRLGNPETDGKVFGTNTWAASTTPQPINNADVIVLPLNTAMTRFRAIATVSGTFNIGDGSNATRYAAGVTINTTWTEIALTTPFHDGTNRKIVFTPTSSYSGTVTSSVGVELLA